MRKFDPTDLTDRQWAVIKDLIFPALHGGLPRSTDLREVLNTLFYQAETGCQWDMLPHELVPKGTARDYFEQWRDDGTWTLLSDELRGRVRQAAGRAVASSGSMAVPSPAGGREESVQLPMLPAGAASEIGFSQAQVG